MFEIRVPSSRRIILTETKNMDLQRALAHADYFEIFNCAHTDWVSYNLDDDVPVLEGVTTLIMRYPDVDGMPHLGTEIEALETLMAKAGVDDRASWKDSTAFKVHAKAKQPARPSGSSTKSLGAEREDSLDLEFSDEPAQNKRRTNNVSPGTASSSRALAMRNTSPSLAFAVEAATNAEGVMDVDMFHIVAEDLGI